MNQFIEHCAAIEKELSKKYGDFALFAIFARTDIENNWDVVVSAKWMNSEREALDIVAKALTDTLKKDEMLKIARIVYLPQKELFVTLINKLFTVQHNPVRIENCELGGLQIKEGYIVSSVQVKSNKLTVNHVKAC
jgi:hypothetical protein